MPNDSFNKRTSFLKKALVCSCLYPWFLEIQKGGIEFYRPYRGLPGPEKWFPSETSLTPFLLPCSFTASPPDPSTSLPFNTPNASSLRALPLPISAHFQGSELRSLLGSLPHFTYELYAQLLPSQRCFPDHTIK